LEEEGTVQSSGNTDATGRAGIHAVGLAVTNGLGWIFREQPTSDYGIDAHIEARDQQSEPSGRLIALQIKSGASYFEEKTKSGYVYRGDLKHLDYWKRHSLPVLVVLTDLKHGSTYWQVVSDEFIKRTSKHWKIEIPFAQHLNKAARKSLREIAEGSPAQRRVDELVLAKPWMDMLARGERLFLEAEEWINKSSGRGSLRLVGQDKDGKDTIVQDWPFVMFPGMLYVEVLPALFPWADMSIDEEFYEDHDEAQFDLECGVWDGEDGRYIFHTEDFHDWRSKFASIRPYECDGEVANFRLELELNKIGRAFLDIEDYLIGGKTSTPNLEGSFGSGYLLGLKAAARRLGFKPKDLDLGDI
jgi:hypothetical protein